MIEGLERFRVTQARGIATVLMAAAEAGAYPRHNRAVRAGFDAVMECAKPGIAAINGPAIGAGLFQND